MTNQERQQRLDVEKWLQSEKYDFDNAGLMPWCSYCDYQTSNGIVNICTHDKNKDVKYPCAKAYNRMTKSIKKNGK